MSSHRNWRPILLVISVALAGAAATLMLGAILGMGGGDLVHLGVTLLPTLLATAIAMAIARPLLARSGIHARLSAVAVIGSVVTLANLAVLAKLMFVSKHDVTIMAITSLYAIGAGVGAALVIGRSSSEAIGRISAGARRLGDGDLTSRVGDLEEGPELQGLAGTLDKVAAQLQAAALREHEIESTRRNLITAVSHDLRTPLSSLRAMVEAIDDGVIEDVPTMRRYAAEMRRSVDSLVSLVDDLFELAQLDAGLIEAETQRVRLEDVVHSALAACEPEAARKGLSVQTELRVDGALCSARMVRVVSNLVANAVRHTPADGTIRIEAERSSGGLELVVENTGEGIAPGDLERVFEPFWRADAARTGGAAGSGTGLGLTLAKRIVEALGGTIRALPAPSSHGARIEVLVPETVG